MFRKTKMKIVLSIMSVLLLFLAMTLLAIYGTNFFSLKKQNEEMLGRYVSLYSLEKPPGDEPPEFSGNPRMDLPQNLDGVAIYRLSSFYSVATGDDGEILSIDAGTNGLYQEEDINRLAGQIREQGKESGIYQNFMYLIDHKEGYTLLAFMDITLTDNNLSTLLLNTLIIGVFAICFFFAVSVILAGCIVRPLEKNDARQKQFVSDAGHELKTPISVVSTNAELLFRQIGENQWLSNIIYENERMGTLVKELLELARTETSSSVQEEIDFSKLAQQEVLPFESVAFECGLTIESRISDRIIVKGSRHQLGQLVSILMDNAISHSIGGKIDAELTKVHRHARFTVSNDGPGIPEDVKTHLFDRFYRIDESHREGDGHFGLGLSIAKAIADAHRGKIEIECKDGRVTFSFSLPAE